MNREIVVRWLHETQGLEPGESLFIPSETREHSRQLAKQFRRELKVMAEIDPLAASRIQILSTIRDQKYWIELRRVSANPMIGFKKTKDGVIARVTLGDGDSEKLRRLMCMKEDGLTLEEVEEIEGQLTEKEREIFNG